MAAETSLDFSLEDNNLTFSRLSSRRRHPISTVEASFRLPYYGSGGVGSVPFRWESQPGTPIHPLSDTPLPPLTPPPSYQLRANGTQSVARKKKGFKILSSIFPIKKMFSGSPTSSSSSSSSLSCYSYSLPPTPMRNSTVRSVMACGGAAEEGHFWKSTLRFRSRTGAKFFRKIF